jgi:hypothetical protein
MLDCRVIQKPAAAAREQCPLGVRRLRRKPILPPPVDAAISDAIGAKSLMT